MLPVIDGLLKEIFPSEKYKEAGKQMVLHYFIALGQPDQMIVDWIDKNPTLINCKNESYLDLTPLIVSVLKGNNIVARTLLEKGADYKIGDHKGWTALHHATVIGNTDACELLRNNLRVDKLLNSLKASFVDLERLINVKPAEDQEKVFYLRKAGKTEMCTALKFKEITKASYCNSVVVKPEKLMVYWRNKPENIEGIFPPEYAANSYQECLKNPLKISLGKLEQDALQGYDVFAEELIAPFKGITIYGGALETNPSCTEYLIENIDGKDIRNLGAMINDGFPNCVSIPVVVKGLRYYVILSLREIKLGERLFLNYGVGHTIKLSGLHLELNKDELIAYAKHINTNFANLCSFTKNKNRRYVLYEREKLKYLLDTPSALIYLLSQSCFPLQAIASLDFDNWDIFGKLSLDKEKYLNQVKIAKLCCGIEVGLQSIDVLKEVDAEIRAILFNWNTTLPTSLIANCLGYFVNSLQKVKSIQDWNNFKSDLNNYLSFMEALLYFCSPIKPNYMDFFPMIKINYLKLGPEKKAEGLKYIKNYVKGVNNQEKLELLNQLIKELGNV